MKFARLMVLLLLVIATVITCVACNGGKETTRTKKNDTAIAAYWCIVIAIYLGASFVTMEWDETWIIWPVAAVLFGAFGAVLSARDKKHK